MVTLVGEPRVIGGNTAQLTSSGKVRITDANGKTKDISAKSFQKQIIANADKIQNGDSFEFKSNNTAKKVGIGASIVALAAGITAAVIYRKNISKFFKETNFKELGADLIEKGKTQFNEGVKDLKDLGTETLDKVQKFGKDAKEYIKDIPNKFPKFKKAAKETAEATTEATK